MYNHNQWAAQQIAAIQLAAAMQFQMQQQGPPPPPLQELAPSDTDDDEDDEEQRTLFCANLDERVTEEILYEAFLQAGPIESVRIPKDNVGKQRSFGFVAYVHACTARYAMQLYQGLAFFRKTLTIKYQGSSSASPSPAQRRSLPTDCESYKQRRSGGGYDNSSLRGGNSYPTYYDTSMNSVSPSENPFRSDSAVDWVKGSSSGGRRNERISKHSSSQSRPHENSVPYQRTESRRSGGDDHQRQRHHHNGNNRRSEQRRGHNRR